MSASKVEHALFEIVLARMSFNEHLAASTPIASRRDPSEPSDSSRHAFEMQCIRSDGTKDGSKDSNGGFSDWNSSSNESSSLSSQAQTSEESIGAESDISANIRELYEPHAELVFQYRARAEATNRMHFERLKDKLAKFLGIIKYLGRLMTLEEKRLRTVKNVETRVVYQNRHSILESLLRLWIKMVEVNARKCRSLQEALGR